jgi:hypothetical protein
VTSAAAIETTHHHGDFVFVHGVLVGARDWWEDDTLDSTRDTTRTHMFLKPRQDAVSS